MRNSELKCHIHAVPGRIVVMMTSSLLVKQVLEMGMCDVIVRCSPDCVAAFVGLHSPVFLTVCESTVRPRPKNKASVCE